MQKAVIATMSNVAKAEQQCATLHHESGTDSIAILEAVMKQHRLIVATQACFGCGSDRVQRLAARVWPECARKCAFQGGAPVTGRTKILPMALSFYRVRSVVLFVVQVFVWASTGFTLFVLMTYFWVQNFIAQQGPIFRFHRSFEGFVWIPDTSTPVLGSRLHF